MQKKQILIDLDTGSVSIEPVGPALIGLLLGGRGLADWVLHRETDRHTDPLGPGNVLILANGLLAGSAAPGSSRLEIAGKSPQTGLVGFSNVGGEFGAALQRAGYQLVVIRGRAPTPACLHVNAEQVRLLPAGDLWGLDCWEAEEALRSAVEEPIEALTIGPAGESLVPFASIIHRRHYAAARSGLGALMGSKNLKAILVSRQSTAGGFDAPAVQAARQYVGHIKSSERFARFATFGVPECSRSSNQAGVLGVRNFNDPGDPAAEAISGETLNGYLSRHKSCYRCPVHCKADVRIGTDAGGAYEGARPEWETVTALGYKCGLFDAEQLIYLSDLCNRMGLDSMSTGSALAFAMDLYARGIISTEDTGGIELTWGDSAAMHSLIRQIARREGFGATLSQGVRAAARVIGRGAEGYAYHVKGMELSTSDPRSVQGLGLGYAVCSRGSDFNNVYTIPESRWARGKGEEQFGVGAAVDRSTLEGKELLVKRTMAVCAAIDCLGICKIPALSLIMEFDLRKEADLARAITGMALDGEELLGIGERVLHLERLINLRLGATRHDDTLPGMFQTVAVASGPNRGLTIADLPAAVEKFYEAMGWDADGVPTAATLRSCGLLDLTS